MQALFFCVRGSAGGGSTADSLCVIPLDFVHKIIQWKRLLQSHCYKDKGNVTRCNNKFIKNITDKATAMK